LQQVALRLPADVSLLSGTSLEDMFVYYEIATAQAYATSSEIRLVIKLPLKGADRVMNLYRIEPLPTYEPMLRRHVQIIPETVFGSFGEQTVLLLTDTARPPQLPTGTVYYM